MYYNNAYYIAGGISIFNFVAGWNLDGRLEKFSTPTPMRMRLKCFNKQHNIGDEERAWYNLNVLILYILYVIYIYTMTPH